jgi:hypothetical protein
VSRGAALQTGDQIVVQIAHMQIPGHPILREPIDINDLKFLNSGQEPGRGTSTNSVAD